MTSMAPVIAIVGATAAGKSDLALDVAERLGGAIVNTDAFQVYRGMDIGTAKLPVEERRGIPHHLMDLLSVDQPLTVAQFQGWAREVIADCRSRDVPAVLVGGSALYTRAILDEFEFPGTDPSIREKWEQRLADDGPAALHESLSALDPEAAAAILPSNGRRLVRALEVVELRGSFTASLPEPSYALEGVVQVGVDIDRPTLHERIEQRVQRMWDAGLVDEVRGLVPHGLREGRTASRALGYSQALAFLDGEISEAQAQEQTVVGTRRFARRQDSWFRKDPRVTWVRYDDPARVEAALGAVPV